ncbi:MAG: nuclear transport factor 2 family protein, partial [Nitrospiraceae bacterium]
ATMQKLMAQDPDIISYSIGGRKYVGWSEFAREMKQEFDSVVRLEIPIIELKIWTRGETAWFAMELDYTRYVGSSGDPRRTVLPLRETGVLERRGGHWLLVAWHESSRNTGFGLSVADHAGPLGQAAAIAGTGAEKPDLSGTWEIQEEDKSYVATLERSGNGTYSWQGGKITTTEFSDRLWQGTWHQPGNDREGGFEILLSEDRTGAEGVWWYTRVGDRKNIPARQWGGKYVWKRLQSHSHIPAPSP